jgi:hypothetical protein
MFLFPEHDPDTAILLAGLGELKPGAQPGETPRLIDRRWWTNFKRRHDGLAHRAVAIEPRMLDRPAGTIPADARARPGRLSSRALKDLREICSAWHDSAGVPMTALIVRGGGRSFSMSHSGGHATDLV